MRELLGCKLRVGTAYSWRQAVLCDGHLIGKIRDKKKIQKSGFPKQRIFAYSHCIVRCSARYSESDYVILSQAPALI